MNIHLARLRRQSDFDFDARRRLFTEHRQPVHRWDRIAFGLALAGLIVLAVSTAWARYLGKPCAPPPAGWVLDSDPMERPCVYLPVRTPS